MAQKIEYIEDGGLVVIRAGIRSELASTFCVEQAQWISSLILAKMMGKDPDPTVAHDTSLVHVRRQRKMRATRTILDRLVTTQDKVDSFTTNYQPPFAAQKWHQDDTLQPVTVIHGSPDGCFDYSLTATTCEEAEQDEDFKTVEVGLGDLVIQLKADQLHRGRNPSDHPRITGVIWEDSMRDLPS